MPTFTKELPNPYNYDKLYEDIQAQYPGAVMTARAFALEVSHANADSGVLDTIIANHNPATLTTIQQENTQADTARANLKTLMQGLHGLSAEDKGYAVYCRLFAWRNGANQQTIDGITNRATAAAYITSLPEWTNMTAASRAFEAKVLEANAAMCQVLLLVLS